jgi:RNA polymerase sigma-70 factor (ECF subfamily)
MGPCSEAALAQETSDETLCRRVAAGDETAFDLLVERHQGRAYRLAWSLLRDAEDARDLSQEAFLRVYRTAGSFRGEARFSTWFHRILVNLCLDHRRRRGWWRQWREASSDGHGTIEAQPASDPDPGDTLERREALMRLWTAAERLAPRQRAALVLHVQDELPASEIAAVLDCSEATVRVHLHRAVSALRRALNHD